VAVDGASSRTPGSRTNRVESPPSRTERGKGGATPFWESLKEWASPLVDVEFVQAVGRPSRDFEYCFVILRPESFAGEGSMD
jgi:hypothetical protein